MNTDFNLNLLLRNNIRNLKPYSSARDEYTGTIGVFLDANENSIGSAGAHNLNRYPDPHHKVLREAIAKVKSVQNENVFTGNGSDEPIDLLFRAFCTPGLDNVILLPPTYGMYEVAANINDIAITKVNLTPDFQLDLPAVFAKVDANTKIIFVCSPNNPTGNLIHTTDIETLLAKFKGIVVVDEAYVDFAGTEIFVDKLREYPNLVVLQTLSKAWGMANIRLGMAFASKAIVEVFDKIKAPYNINGVTQQLALNAIQNVAHKTKMVNELLEERAKLAIEFESISYIEKVFPSDANFILIKVADPHRLYDYLVEKQIIVRDRSSQALCEGCLRITIGSADQNVQLLEIMKSYTA